MRLVLDTNVVTSTPQLLDHQISLGHTPDHDEHDHFRHPQIRQAAGSGRGASSQLAEALAEALDRSLATKPDIVRLENRIEPLEMKSESKFSLLPWMIAVLIALAVANFAQQFF